MVTLQLSDPVGTALEPHRWTTLTIVDEEDQPVVSLASVNGLQMNEDVGRGAIKVTLFGLKKAIIYHRHKFSYRHFIIFLSFIF